MLKAISRARAWIERSLFPHHSWCYCCRRPWSRVDGHMTPYAEGQSCFPLCKSCWSRLTPLNRLPYYRMLWEAWEGRDDDVPWSVIHVACLHERECAPDVLDTTLPPEVVAAWEVARC